MSSRSLTGSRGRSKQGRGRYRQEGHPSFLPRPRMPTVATGPVSSGASDTRVATRVGRVGSSRPSGTSSAVTSGLRDRATRDPSPLMSFSRQSPSPSLQTRTTVVPSVPCLPVCTAPEWKDHPRRPVVPRHPRERDSGHPRVEVEYQRYAHVQPLEVTPVERQLVHPKPKPQWDLGHEMDGGPCPQDQSSLVVRGFDGQGGDWRRE